MIYELIETGRASALFAGWQDSVVWSALQGDDGKNICGFSGKTGEWCCYAWRFLLPEWKPESEVISGALANSASEEVILVPQNDDWAQMIVECYGEKAEKAPRYAIKKEPGIFDLEKLLKVTEKLPKEYEMRLIDQSLFEICRDTQWSKDLTANYESYSQYKEYGLGVCILTGGEVVAGISSYSGYGRRSDENLGCHGGIEIEVVTREDYRRKGLAYIGAARLLLECDKRGLYPNWDAANKMSVGLAEKLGYHFSHEYVVYKVKK